MIALSFIIPLVILGAIVAGVVAVTKKVGQSGSNSANAPVRRFVVYAFALGVLILAAVGVAQTLALLLPEGPRLVGRSSGDIAAAFAMTIVGVPVFGLLWRWLSGRLREDEEERESLGWAVFVAAAAAIFLVGGLTGLANGLEWIIGLDASGQTALAFGITWTAVWVWIWNLGHSAIRPQHFTRLSATFGSAVGLTVGAGSSIFALALVTQTIYDGLFTQPLSTSDLASDLLRAAIWLILAGAIWWWHWLKNARLEVSGALPRVYLLVLGVLGGAVIALSSAGFALFGILQWFFGEPTADSAATHFSSMPGALSAALVGLAVWRYHRLVVLEFPSVMDTETGKAYGYLLSGVGLITAASGLGVIINALLGVFVEPVIERGGNIDTLLGGITALAVGAPVWWMTWVPRARAERQTARPSTSRRVYLTLLAGIGGLVAIISLIVLLFQLIEGILDGNRVAAIVDAVRAPLGIVVATAIVAGYHLAVWQRDRQLHVGEPVERRLKGVILVSADGGSDDLSQLLGVPVTHWRRADEAAPTDVQRVADAVSGVDATRVLVISSGEDVDVIPLA